MSNKLDPIITEAYSDEYHLSEHFTYGEFIISQTAERLGIANRPTEQEVQNMRDLCQNVLEPIRVYYQKPVVISSGFRCEELNSKIGGSSTSQHRFGQAADFIIPGVSITEIYEWVILNSGIDRDQIIHEFGRWIHISYNKDNNRKINTVATKVNGHTQYQHYTKEQISIGNYNHA